MSTTSSTKHFIELFGKTAEVRFSAINLIRLEDELKENAIGLFQRISREMVALSDSGRETEQPESLTIRVMVALTWAGTLDSFDKSMAEVADELVRIHGMSWEQPMTAVLAGLLEAFADPEAKKKTRQGAKKKSSVGESSNSAD